jgi:hypothetical protein
MDLPDINQPPNYCPFINGPCGETFNDALLSDAFFIYPLQPQILANTILETIKQLQQHSSGSKWLSWQNLSVDGHIIFCKICQALRSSKLIVADITSANFNVLFELGYAIGLRRPILPVRDSSYERHNKIIEEIGIFDTLGYQGFSNNKELVSHINSKKTFAPAINLKTEVSKQLPIYYLKSHIDTDASIKITSCLKKSYFRFRTFDPKETSRLSLHDAFKQVMISTTVIAHLMDIERKDAVVNNARAAFVSGLAMAAGKYVLMIQEGDQVQPIDYRDIIRHYSDAQQIPHILSDALRNTADSIQSIEDAQIPLPKGLIERIDLGDIAAENEIQTLGLYFVKTPQFQQARQGHARLITGRKGSGKSALFYGIRNQFYNQRKYLVIDLKPEGHQFTKLKENILKDLTEGLKEHTLTAFWHYLLLMEIAHKLVDYVKPYAYESRETIDNYRKLETVFNQLSFGEGDFSERLMKMIERLITHSENKEGNIHNNSHVTSIIYGEEIKNLYNAIVPNLNKIETIWILFDNIDKGFPSYGINHEDILNVRCLVESTRKIQRTFNEKDITFNSIIFLRRDVYDLLIDNTPDRGKESIANLDWSDPELVKELLLRRFKFQASELTGNFEEVWGRLFDYLIEGESSFQYIINRTFLRPRDILNFVSKCLQVCISRGHERVETIDINAAEKEFSEDMLNAISYEIRDVFPETQNIFIAFYKVPKLLSNDDLELIFNDIGITNLEQISKLIERLLWFSFLGYRKGEDEYYSYQFLYNIPKLRNIVKDQANSKEYYVIHPAFHKALDVKVQA